MKAEEYILNNSFVVYYPAAKCTRVVIDYKALQALNMARKEEREKAIKALDIAIMAIFERNTHSVSMGELRAQFNKLLNE
jgi:hypothetical protein